MPYTCTLERFLSALELNDQEGVNWLRANHRQTVDGQLPVGLKIHILPKAHDSFKELARALKGAPSPALFDNTIGATNNMYKLEQASVCLVLPPVGSAPAAIRLLESLGRAIGASVWANQDIQVQICSPGRLDKTRSAMLGVVFYLSSDTFRSYTPEELKTTVQFDSRYLRSPRLVIYDGYNQNGDFDPNFEYWTGAAHAAPERLPQLPISRERSDVIAGKVYRNDIRNVNLAATLLAHAQFGGYWNELGLQFEQDISELLAENGLKPIIEAPWVSTGPGEDVVRTSDDFTQALEELISFAWNERDRILRQPDGEPGLLFKIQDLMKGYRSVMKETADSFMS